MTTKTIGLLILFVGLAVIFFSGLNCALNAPEKEKTIELTQKDLIAIFQNGYLSGTLNYIQSNSIEEDHAIWRKDSLRITDLFFSLNYRKGDITKFFKK